MTVATASHNLDFSYVRQLMRGKAALVLDETKSSLIVSRLTPLVKSEGYDSLSALIKDLPNARSRTLREKVVASLLTHETSFFRDGKIFDVLRSDIIPTVMKARQKERKLKIWSAASSSGQEAYTLAMILRHDFPQLINWQLDIDGTDYSQNIVAKAKKAQYTRFECNRGLPDEFKSKYFDKTDLSWTVSAPIRKMVNFSVLNLVDHWPNMKQYDIVLLRNVLIYFDSKTKERVLRKIRKTMRSDGYLILGSSESQVFLKTPFERERIQRSDVYRPV